MTNKKTMIILSLTVLAGIILQLLLIIPDMKDTPTRAAVEFAKAYFAADKDMENRLCDEDRDAAEIYLQGKYKSAHDRGFGMFYLHNKLYEIRTHIIRQDAKSAEIRLTAKARPPLKSFFTNEGYKHVDKVFKLIDDHGKWKICDQSFSTEKGAI